MNDLLKSNRSQRHRNDYGFVKCRVAARTLPALWTHASLKLLCHKMVPNLLGGEISTIENATKNQLFINVRHWDPLKTVPGSGFEK